MNQLSQLRKKSGMEDMKLSEANSLVEEQKMKIIELGNELSTSKAECATRLKELEDLQNFNRLVAEFSPSFNIEASSLSHIFL